MKKYKSGRAILILESPWELDDDDANRSSVLPFIEGVAKFAGDIEVFHANFYDKRSFKKALEFLCKSKYQSTTIYIAAHGSEKTVGNVQFSDILFSIGSIAKDYNIDGVLIGSCYAASNTITMEVYIQETNIKWCAGYSGSISWLEGTLIDSSILANLALLNIENYSSRREIIKSFARAIAPFSNNFPFIHDKRGKPIFLQQGMEITIQPKGKGHRALTNTKDIFDEIGKIKLHS